MNFVRVSGAASGSSLKGHIDVSYQELVETFGEPTNPSGDGYKTDAEWTLRFEDGVIATIYNYKDGKNYLGFGGAQVGNIRDWHVGGYEPEALEHVLNALTHCDP